MGETGKHLPPSLPILPLAASISPTPVPEVPFLGNKITWQGGLVPGKSLSELHLPCTLTHCKWYLPPMMVSWFVSGALPS